MRLQNIQSVLKPRLITMRSKPIYFVVVAVVDIVIRIKHIQYQEVSGRIILSKMSDTINPPLK